MNSLFGRYRLLGFAEAALTGCLSHADYPPYNRFHGNKTHQNTISSKNLKIHYPFHPLYGHKLEVLSKGNSKSGNKNGTVIVKAPNGFCKEVPIWMTEPRSASCCISRNAEISPKAILKLIELLECSIEGLKF